MRVVLDTNVIVSGLNFPGNERLVLELALRGRFELCLSPFILEEVEGVLGRKFGWDEELTSQALRALGDAATVIEPRRLPEVVGSGHADNRVLECAVEASAKLPRHRGPEASAAAWGASGYENPQCSQVPVDSRKPDHVSL